MVTRTPSTTTATTPALISGSGSLNGIAAQVSLPNISTSRLQCRWAPGCAGSRVAVSRRCLVEDALEQVRLDRAISRWRHGLAGLCQGGITGVVKRGPRAAHLLHPGGEVAGRQRLDHEPHVGKAVAAEI